ncbi:MAG: CocE/NonD family hydrolase, partial [Bacteroidales bacterium]|nr:CocE/NonD family hydrolase [Bacteroidales bacterium]
MKIVFTAVLLICFLELFSQPLSPEVVSIEMRDAKFLAADVYVPDNEYPRPTILIQTPYNKFYYRYSLPLNVGTDLENSQYNFVIVDWRGFYASASATVANMNRGQDGYDVIDWIVEQEWSNGKVGTWGPSALGKIQYETAREQHPAHICAVPLVASPEFLYQTYYPYGAYRKEYVDQLDALGYGMSTTLLANPHYNATWTYVENLYFYPQQFKIPMLLIGGWYDHNIIEMVKYFDDIRELSDITVRDQHRFLIGPWAHGGFGMAQVGTEQQGELFFPEAAEWSTDKALEFFAYYLLDADNAWLTSNPTIQFFQMGDMTWHGTEVWPPEGLTQCTYYLTESQQLSTIQPIDADDFSEIVYDPRDPSPTVGGPTLRQDLEQGPYDQAPVVESREDILLFTSEELDEPVKVLGKPTITLFVSSDRLDTDFAVRLCDVYPDDRSMILNDNIFRMRFRDGYTVNDTNFMHLGEIYEIEIEMPDLAHTFLPGHKIRLDISSSNYPRFDNNLNNGGQMYVSGDTLIATNRVYHNQTYSSYIEFQVDNTVDLQTIEEKGSVNIYPNPLNQ